MLKTKLFASVATALSILILAPSVAHATVVNTTSPNAVSDDFSSAVSSPNQTLPWDYWYQVLDSGDAVGFLRKENLTTSITCNNAVCMTNETEGSTQFLRMKLSPEQYTGGTNGIFNLAQIGEQRDGFSYNQTHRWLPTAGHPVVVNARFRASSNYHADGTGGAVGTFGFWLQNNANQLTGAGATDPERNNTFTDNSNNLFSMGFNWSDQNTLGGLYTGFRAGVVDKVALTAPLTSIPLTTYNINDWTDVKWVWSTNILNVQTVTFFVNGQQVGFEILAIPAPSLNFIAWSDNEEPQLGSGGIVYNSANPVADQNFDIDSVSISQ